MPAKIITDDIVNLSTQKRSKLDKLPTAIGPLNKKGGSRSLGVLSAKLGAVMDWKACDVAMTKQYALQHDIDPTVATVADILVHNQLFWALNGSAPHAAQLFDRIEGKVSQEVVTRDKGGKMSITDAVRELKLGAEPEE